MGSNDPSTPSKASKASEQAYSAMPPHGFFPPSVAANPQAHPYMWGAQPMVPPYGTPPPPYVMYPPGTVYAHPSTPPGMHPFNHYPMPTNGNAEFPGAASIAPEMNGESYLSESGSESESDGSDANSQNDSQSKDNDGKQDGSSQNGTSYSASQGMVNQAMPMLPIQPGAMVGVPGSTTNLNIGMDYWSAPGSAAVPAMHSKAPAGSGRGDHWDERELKKQKRKQSNRESARRSRLRKQAECEELGQRAESLRSENSSLRAELEQIRKEYEQLLSQNASLKERLGGTSDSVPDMNEQNDGDGSSKRQPDSDAQPESEP
ncbi:hypothetical protein PR202_ga06347 [Eleusine coracana subsp. coracana]|uniref:BZIP domain-containing protein n=1 Tax=Eleusine coracana subsp. coracana TaxID=191504 RepID=A0AAV5BY84_ELECO|nr:hypothetical protein PR202_ga06347 [Eleusine coracana subsp. coracana]